MSTRQNKRIVQFSVMVALAFSAVAAQAEPIIYAAAVGSGKLVKIDVGGGSVTEIGSMEVIGADAIAISPQGKLYTVTEGWPPPGVSPQLARIDINTGKATAFGVNLTPEVFMGIGFTPDGELYGVNAATGTDFQNSLHRFDLATGEIKRRPVIGSLPGVMDLAVHPDGTMYGASPDSLYRINSQTGQGTLVTKIQGLTRIMGLAIDDDGNFYVSEIFADSPLYRVDPSTGAAIKIMDTGMPFIHGLEIIPTPQKAFAITFEKSLVSPGVWDGSVDIDGDGQEDGAVHYVDEPGTQVIEGNILRFSGRYHITTHFYAFTALMQVRVNLKSGSIHGEGLIETGWLDGSEVDLRGKANLSMGYSAGLLRITP